MRTKLATPCILPLKIILIIRARCRAARRLDASYLTCLILSSDRSFSKNLHFSDRSFNPNRSLDIGEIARLCHAACFSPSRRRSGLRRGVARNRMRTEAGKMPESLISPIRNGHGVSNDRFGFNEDLHFSDRSLKKFVPARKSRHLAYACTSRKKQDVQEPKALRKFNIPTKQLKNRHL